MPEPMEVVSVSLNHPTADADGYTRYMSGGTTTVEVAANGFKSIELVCSRCEHSYCVHVHGSMYRYRETQQRQAALPPGTRYQRLGQRKVMGLGLAVGLPIAVALGVYAAVIMVFGNVWVALVAATFCTFVGTLLAPKDPPKASVPVAMYIPRAGDVVAHHASGVMIPR